MKEIYLLLCHRMLFIMAMSELNYHFVKRSEIN
jgi:hypothetical protein